MAKKENNKVTLQIVDEGGMEASLHIYLEGDYRHGAGALATMLFAALAITLEGKHNPIADMLPEEVKEMIAYHVGMQHDPKTSGSKHNPNQSTKS